MIVITGAAGFIGSNLLISLRERGHTDIVVCERAGEDERWRNLAKHPFARRLLPEELPTFLDANKVEAIFHMGAISDTTATDATEVLTHNFLFTQTLWERCAKHGIRFIYASSAATYGDGSRGFSDTTPLEQLQPLNLYGWSKQLFDLQLSRYAAWEQEPPQWAGLKFFNVYGPNEHHKGGQMSVVCKNYPVVAKGGAVRLFKSDRPDYADGEQLRDFIYVKDCVNVMLWLFDNPQVSGLFNVGTGKARSFNDLFAALRSATGNNETRIEYIDMPRELSGKYQYFTEADMKKLRAAGYTSPFTSLEVGVADYVQSYLSQPEPYR